MQNPIIIFGAGSLAKISLEIFESNSYIIFGFLDDDLSLKGTEINQISVLGSTDDEGFLKLIGKKCDAFVAVQEVKLRKKIVEYLIEYRKSVPVNAIHERAIISKFAQIGYGNLLDSYTSLAPNTDLGSYCVLRSGVKVENHAQIGDFVQIGSGATIGENVVIKDGAFIGQGAHIIAGVKIGNNASIGAGAVVVSDVANSKKVFGNPAQLV